MNMSAQKKKKAQSFYQTKSNHEPESAKKKLFVLASNPGRPRGCDTTLSSLVMFSMATFLGFRCGNSGDNGGCQKPNFSTVGMGNWGNKTCTPQIHETWGSKESSSYLDHKKTYQS